MAVAGGVVSNPRNGPQPVEHIEQPAPSDRYRGRLSGRAKPGDHWHRVHHHVGQPDRHIHRVHEPAATVVAGHHRGVWGGRRRRRDHAIRTAAAHHRRHHGHGDHRAPLGQGRQRMWRQFQWQRVQHGRPEDTGDQ